MSSIALVHFLMFAASALQSGAVISSQGKEVIIREGDRPTDRWRSFGGRCGENRYEVTIGSGEKLSQSVREAKVDGVSFGSALRKAMAAWANNEGLPMDVVIDRCEPGRARIAFHVWRPSDGATLHFYYLWLDNNGNVQLLGER